MDVSPLTARCALIALLISGSAHTQAQPVFNVDFDWKMPKRFGLDNNSNNMVDVPNTRAYVNPDEVDGVPRFTVEFSSRNSSISIDGTTYYPKKYVWTIKDLSGNVVVSKELRDPNPNPSIFQAETTARWNTKLKEGVYDVELQVSRRINGTLLSGNLVRRISINDVLIVSLGDSFASGEGNPEKVMYFWNPYFPEHNEVSLNRILTYWADNGDQINEAEFFSRSLAGTNTTNSTVDQRLALGEALSTAMISAYIAVNPIESEGISVGDLHQASHRSTLSAHAQVALDVEGLSDHSSTTFVFLPRTGATIRNGLFADGVNLLPGVTAPDVRDNQIEKMKSLVGNREIDILLISIGVNDVGFGNIIQAALTFPRVCQHYHCDGTSRSDYFSNLTASFRSGNWDYFNHKFRKRGLFDPISFKATSGGNALNSDYRRVMDAIKSLRINNVYITEYPFPGTDGAGEYCDEILKEVIGASNPLGWNGDISAWELEFIHNNIYTPLQSSIKSNALANRWVYVSGINEKFATRGACMWAPSYDYEQGHYPGNRNMEEVEAPSAQTRFFRRDRESMLIQGPFEMKDSKGALHPNEYGHQAVKEEIYRTIDLSDVLPNRGNSMTNPLAYRGLDFNFLDAPEQLKSYSSIDILKTYISKKEKIGFQVTADIHCRLFNSLGAEVTATITNGPGSNKTFTYDIIQEGNYFLGTSMKKNESYDPFTGGNTVNPYFGAGALPTATSMDKTTGLEVVYVNDPDNVKENSNAVSLSAAFFTSVAGHAIEHPGDADFFKFDITTPGTYSFAADTRILNTERLTKAKYDANDPSIFSRHQDINQLSPLLTLYDATGTQLSEGTKVTHELTNGQYYIKVSSRNIIYIEYVAAGILRPSIQVAKNIFSAGDLQFMKDSLSATITPLYNKALPKNEILSGMALASIDVDFPRPSAVIPSPPSITGYLIEFDLQKIKQFKGTIPSFKIAEEVSPIVKTKGFYTLIIDKI